MIAQELVKPGASFKGADGEVRHVYMIHRPGNGYGVSWDSVPQPQGTRAILDWWDTQKSRPHGYMPMRKFQRWAVEKVEAAALARKEG